MAVSSLGCLSEASSGFLGSAVILDIYQLDLSILSHSEAMAQTIGVLQICTGGTFNNRSRVSGHILVPYILIK